MAREFMDARDARVEGVFGALFVRLLAAFERFMRRLIEEALAVHTGRAPIYDELPDHIRIRNTALTGNLLASIESPRSHLALQFDSLIRDLASCRPGSAAYHLNVQAFAAVVAGVGPPTLDRALANVGVSNWWDKLAADSSLASILGTRGPRATGKLARDKMEELWRWRNHLAHAGDEEVTFTEQQLHDCLAFVRAFAAALDGVVFSHLRLRARPQRHAARSSSHRR